MVIKNGNYNICYRCYQRTNNCRRKKKVIIVVFSFIADSLHFSKIKILVIFTNTIIVRYALQQHNHVFNNNVINLLPLTPLRKSQIFYSTTNPFHLARSTASQFSISSSNQLFNYYQSLRNKSLV